jgi:hypothetical protein
MTTFTSDDREEEYKKILEETQALEKGLEFFKKLKGDNASPPHIVDSGASVMENEPVAYINVEERKLEWAKPTTWHTPTVAKMGKIPLYTHPSEHDLGIAEAIGFDKGYKAATAKTLTDEEIWTVAEETRAGANFYDRVDFIDFARAILRKAQEK